MTTHNPQFLFKEGFFGAFGSVENKAASSKVEAFASDDTLVRIDHQDGNPNSSLLSTIDGPITSVRAMYAPAIGESDINLTKTLKGIFSRFIK